MNSIVNENRPIITEYRHVVAANTLKSVWRDSMSAFGWRLEKCVPALSRNHRASQTMTEFVFSRGRDIPNRPELDRLQARFENLAGELVQIERSERATAACAACILGFAGTALLAGSALALSHGSVGLSAAAAVHGCAAWFLLRPLYEAMLRQGAVRAAPRMGKHYAAIRSLCEQADFVRSRELAG